MLDPRTAPLIGIDRQLPALPAQRLRGPALRQR
ncbi:coenzyme A pyrophosphatase, partial [Malikia spinosa]|nr:coenzyme A pyrophosphatase [Malikia spinosa]